MNYPERSRLESIYYFFLTTGMFLVFISASSLLVFHVQGIESENAGIKVINSSEIIFVNLMRSVKKSYSGSYFFSYTGNYRNMAFTRFERVNADLFHISSEGKNIQAKIYTDEWGNIFTLLRENTLPYGKDYASLFVLTKIFLFAGILFFLAGISAHFIIKNSSGPYKVNSIHEND